MTPAPATFLLLHLLLFLRRSAALNADGAALFSFKYYAVSDPLSILASWNYSDASPCAWTGVICAAIPGTNLSDSRVVGLVLPGARIIGSLTPDLGLLDHLRHLDLSGNSLEGSIPAELFHNGSELRILNLAGNHVTGQLPENLAGNLRDLQCLNLSRNSLSGMIPESLGSLPNLTVVALSGNNFSGQLPVAGFRRAEVLDLSGNRLEGTLLPNLTAADLRLLNLSSNQFSGNISPEFAAGFPASAVVDFSFNNLTGEIPGELQNRDIGAFMGNPGLCGRPLDKLCVAPATPFGLPSPSEAPPAIAAIPKSMDGPESGGVEGGGQPRRVGLMKPGVIAVIVAGNLAGVGILAMVWVYFIQARKKKRRLEPEIRAQKEGKNGTPGANLGGAHEWSSPESGPVGWSCMGKKGGGQGGEKSDTTGSDSDSEMEAETLPDKKGLVVAVDGESGLETEKLLKASAYILGASGGSIIYKAVLEDGTPFAVRRIGKSRVDSLRDLETQVRLYAKLRHPNLIRIRGFYWGDDEKLLIYNYAPNGSLANLPYKKKGTSPLNLSWEVRLRVAKGVARGLAYLHDKKHVHGNLKPSNILLGEDMEPMVGDFGLERALVAGDKANSRHFGSKRSTISGDSDGGGTVAMGASPSGSIGGGGSAYQAPESLKNLKPNTKWDVYSFGIVLLELLSGRVFGEREVSQWNTGFIAEDRIGVLRMVDVGLKSEVGGKEEALVTCFRLGFQCASVNPQRRPNMKDALQVLEKIPSSSSHHSRRY